LAPRFAPRVNHADQHLARQRRRQRRDPVHVVVFAALTLAVLMSAGASHAADKKPNIVVIMVDDVGIWNISAYRNLSLKLSTNPFCIGLPGSMK